MDVKKGMGKIRKRLFFLFKKMSYLETKRGRENEVERKKV